MSITFVLVAREVRAYLRQRRTIVAMIVLAAFLANAGHAIVLVSPLVHLNLVARHYAAASVNISGRRALAQSALLWIGLLPILFSAQQAAITIAAERERRSLTALLATPISIRSILYGKLFGSLAPGMLMLVVAYVVYLVSIASAAPGASSWVPLSLVLSVLALLVGLSLLMNSIALFISALASTVAGASITATFVLLPLSFAIATLSVKVSDVGPAFLAALACGALATTIVVITLAGRFLTRGRLLVIAP